MRRKAFALSAPAKITVQPFAVTRDCLSVTLASWHWGRGADEMGQRLPQAPTGPRFVRPTSFALPPFKFDPGWPGAVSGRIPRAWAGGV